MTSHREALIGEAEAYARDGLSLPLDLISSLMQEGIDHTQFTDPSIPLDPTETHNDFLDDGEGDYTENHNVD